MVALWGLEMWSYTWKMPIILLFIYGTNWSVLPAASLSNSLSHSLTHSQSLSHSLTISHSLKLEFCVLFVFNYRWVQNSRESQQWVCTQSSSLSWMLTLQTLSRRIPRKVVFKEERSRESWYPWHRYEQWKKRYCSTCTAVIFHVYFIDLTECG